MEDHCPVGPSPIQAVKATPRQSGKGLPPWERSSFLLLKYLGVWACPKRPEVNLRHSPVFESCCWRWTLTIPVWESFFQMFDHSGFAGLLACILSMFLHLRDPCNPASFPRVPGLGNATNTISVMSFAAWMKERKSWLSKPPQRCGEGNVRRHMTDS